MAFRRIGVVSAVPAAGVKPGEGAAANALRVDLGQVLEITLKNASGGAAGTATLLRWFPPPQNPQSADGFVSTLSTSGEWRVWREDSPIIVSAGESYASGRYDVPRDSTEYWLLFSAVTTLTADAQGVYYRGDG